MDVEMKLQDAFGYKMSCTVRLGSDVGHISSSGIFDNLHHHPDMIITIDNIDANL